MVTQAIVPHASDSRQSVPRALRESLLSEFRFSVDEAQRRHDDADLIINLLRLDLGMTDADMGRVELNVNGARVEARYDIFPMATTVRTIRLSIERPDQAIGERTVYCPSRLVTVVRCPQCELETWSRPVRDAADLARVWREGSVGAVHRCEGNGGG